MAVRPTILYPAQTTADAEYPHGKAKNQNTPGDGLGTPLEQGWLNEIWGFQQSLLAAAAITPDGNPEKVGASQYLTAMQALIASAVAASQAALQAQLDVLKTFGHFAISGMKSTGDTYDLTELKDVSPTGNFIVEGGTHIKFPRTGRYLISVYLQLSRPSPSNVGYFGGAGASEIFAVEGADSGNGTVLSAVTVQDIPDVDLLKLSVTSTHTQQTGSGSLVIRLLDAL